MTDRSAQVRTEDERRAEQRAMNYMIRSELNLDPALVKHFADQGYTLSWLRHIEPGTSNTVDQRNLSKKKREGWELVSKLSLPDAFREDYDSVKIDKNNQVVCVGDLVLGKIRTNLRDAKKRYFRDLSNQQVDAARAEARKTTGNSRMDRYIPVEDETEQTYRG